CGGGGEGGGGARGGAWALGARLGRDERLQRLQRIDREPCLVELFRVELPVRQRGEQRARVHEELVDLRLAELLDELLGAGNLSLGHARPPGSARRRSPRATRPPRGARSAALRRCRPGSRAT